MHLHKYSLRNYRRLEDVEITLEKNDTVFVGANNSGKTSATTAFHKFITKKSDFKVHDFSSQLVKTIDFYGDHGKNCDGEQKLPSIEMDLWFTVDENVEYGKVSALLSTYSELTKEIGIRIVFEVNDLAILHQLYRKSHPITVEGDLETKPKSLCYFLAQGSNLKKYFGLKYYKLEKNVGNEYIATQLENEDGPNTVKTLIHVEFVDAQRNIDDNNTATSNRLSKVFADFYTNNLKKQEHDSASIKLIEKSNDGLTAHYANEFAPLLKIISSLGFPPLNDRALSIISELNPIDALSGNTALTYIQADTQHKLPEAYNGLGYKNLIYIAIQIAHFQIRWAEIENNRPLCLLVFIEEPEAHLHAQVQQTFIRQIKKIVEQTAGLTSLHTHQLVITTHSSHIIAEADFQCIRYFRRSSTKYPEIPKIPPVIATEILNLADFNTTKSNPENITFLKKFIKLTHCDLFFADAVILVEGTVEKLLLPTIISRNVPQLESAFLCILELGGAFAHRFVSLLEFINIPSLVITDLDSVDPTAPDPTKPKSKGKACRADKKGAVTSNASIKELIGEKDIALLIKMTNENKEKKSGNYHQYVTFQQKIAVPQYGDDLYMIPRTFEETFIYENMELVRSNLVDVLVTLPKEKVFENDYELVYSEIKESGYKKVEFALNQIESAENWKAPDYVIEGLTWLTTILKLTTPPKIEDLEANEISKEKAVIV